MVDLPPERLRDRPGLGEWSSIEVVGHLVDKLNRWGGRAATVLREEGATLEPYDQDECVRQGEYQTADLDLVLGRLVQAAERFARMVEPLTEPELQRRARHTEYGTISLRQCVVLPLESVPDHLRQAEAAAAVG